MLALYYNRLTGTIPTEIGKLEKLEYLNLHSNALEGTIPEKIANLTALTSFSLHRNQLTGTIPAGIWNLTSLETLRLYENQLSGSIPSQIKNLTLLTELRLNGNQFGGPIPSEIGQLVNLTMLLLSHNQFEGTIPKEIGNLTGLTDLQLSANQLAGTIPVELGHLFNLIRLRLDGNQFSGPIPEGLAHLPKLEKFILNFNQFTDLPDLSLDTSLVELKIANNKFTFKDIEPNMFVPDFSYSPQDSIGIKQDTTIDKGSQLFLSVSVGGMANEYQWQKDDIDIPGANSNLYTIEQAEETDQGSYICKITNTIAEALTLYSRPIFVTVNGEVDIAKSRESIPHVFKLFPNYPNPFNPKTTIKYSLPEPGFVTIKIYNLAGQEMDILVNKYQKEGVFQINWFTKNIPSGIYFCKLQAGHFSDIKKLILQR
ncbi:T9SS type A sorting domain-containing protein [candidate division KSB1 bacterium]|nr:T9SS type A sorting domain-containing protein [candidate division KSB1 bacterium]